MPGIRICGLSFCSGVGVYLWFLIFVFGFRTSMLEVQS